jgi:hypothetical protein
VRYVCSGSTCRARWRRRSQVSAGDSDIGGSNGGKRKRGGAGEGTPSIVDKSIGRMGVSSAMGRGRFPVGARVGKQVAVLIGNSLSEATLDGLVPLTSSRWPGTFQGSVRDLVLSEFFRTRFS